jgi:acetoin utilization protein AcuB
MRSGSPRRPTTVGDFMRRQFITVSADESLREARGIMRMARLRHLLVEREGILVGILSYRDLQEWALARLERPEAGLEPFDTASVAGAMAAPPICSCPQASLAEAALRLARLGLGCLPVVEDTDGGPRLVGLLTESDLLRAVFDDLGRAPGRNT